jgi:hypothetical protein
MESRNNQGNNINWGNCNGKGLVVLVGGLVVVVVVGTFRIVMCFHCIVLLIFRCCTSLQETIWLEISLSSES